MIEKHKYRYIFFNKKIALNLPMQNQISHLQCIILYVFVCFFFLWTCTANDFDVQAKKSFYVFITNQNLLLFNIQ